MTELHPIYSVWREASARGESGVLATVVRVDGSTYRRAGAHLLLTSGGKRVGSVSGGCLEADLLKKAWWLTESGAAIRRYDTTGEGEIPQEFGLGCHGVIHVLIERLDGQTLSPLIAVSDVRSARQAAFLATVIQADGAADVLIGQRAVLFPSGELKSTIGNSSLAVFAEAALNAAPRMADLLPFADGNVHAQLFVEPVLPTLRLLVFGAGDDVLPVVRLAKFMGYEVVVLDGRSHLARPERFVEADDVRLTTDAAPLANLQLDEWTAAVLMSHSYSQDLAALRALAKSPLVYLGMLGPRKRAERLLGEANISIEKIGCALHSPVGLDIGADGAEQIALAVIAELQSVVNRRAGGRLREKAGPLHITDRLGVGPLRQDTLACPMG